MSFSALVAGSNDPVLTSPGLGKPSTAPDTALLPSNLSSKVICVAAPPFGPAWPFHVPVIGSAEADCASSGAAASSASHEATIGLACIVPPWVGAAVNDCVCHPERQAKCHPEERSDEGSCVRHSWPDYPRGRQPRSLAAARDDRVLPARDDKVAG